MLSRNELVWHYTTGDTYDRIVESGLLCPTAIGVVPPEKPVLWFSEHPSYEPTAIKSLLRNGVIHKLSVPELYRFGGGLCRLGYSTAGLHHDRDLREVALISRDTWRGLMSSGRRQGGNPLHWWGTTEAIPLGRLVVEMMDRNWTWNRLSTLESDSQASNSQDRLYAGTLPVATGKANIPRF